MCTQCSQRAFFNELHNCGIGEELRPFGRRTGSWHASLPVLPNQPGLSRDTRRGLAARCLTVPCQVGHNAKQSLDYDELCAVMHLMLFAPDEHLKPAL